MFKEVLKLPGWNDGAGCCAFCSIRPEQVSNPKGLRKGHPGHAPWRGTPRLARRSAAWWDPSVRPRRVSRMPLKVGTDVGDGAAWRTDRRTWADLMGTIIMSGQQVCPLFHVPFASLDILKLDWLHAADLGVSADFIGSMLWYICVEKRIAGNTQNNRMDALWADLLGYYDRNKTENRLPALNKGTIKSKEGKKAPKLRCSAGMCRLMVPWAQELAVKLLDPEDAVESSIL